LELLDQYQAQVTFFNIGKNVVTWPEVVRDVAMPGHYIADHTWDHANLEGMPAEQFIQEADKTRQPPKRQSQMQSQQRPAGLNLSRMPTTKAVRSLLRRYERIQGWEHD